MSLRNSKDDKSGLTRQDFFYLNWEERNSLLNLTKQIYNNIYEINSAMDVADFSCKSKYLCKLLSWNRRQFKIISWQIFRFHDDEKCILTAKFASFSIWMLSWEIQQKRLFCLMFFLHTNLYIYNLFNLKKIEIIHKKWVFL